MRLIGRVITPFSVKTPELIDLDERNRLPAVPEAQLLEATQRTPKEAWQNVKAPFGKVVKQAPDHVGLRPTKMRPLRRFLHSWNRGRLIGRGVNISFFLSLHTTLL
ncbi:unnamed protein product [Protopolystoma xenopodis]|uniref:Uncharacterized protein n=1 Tax=Protopolystoma xenopodis TaxID=117903 RepID=A0A3S5A497_9PLAT|nr:unnamed protein product [Protopolystoma xenopodis]